MKIIARPQEGVEQPIGLVVAQAAKMNTLGSRGDPHANSRRSLTPVAWELRACLFKESA